MTDELSVIDPLLWQLFPVIYYLFSCSGPTSSSSIAFCHSINLSQKDKCSRLSSSSPWALHCAFLVINHLSSVERDFSRDSWRVFFRAICWKRQSNFLIIIFENWYKVLVYWRIFNSLIGHKCIHILGSVIFLWLINNFSYSICETMTNMSWKLRLCKLIN